MYYLTPIINALNKETAMTGQYVTDEVVKQDREAWIRNAIRERWLLGRKPDGTLIGIYRNYGYASEKYSKNPLAGFDHVDLTLTGSLGKGIKVSFFGGTQFEIYSTDSKYLSISETFGDANFNLSSGEADEFLGMIADFVIGKQIQNIYG